MWLNNQRPDKANTQTRWQRGEGKDRAHEGVTSQRHTLYCTVRNSRMSQVVNKDVISTAIQLGIYKVIKFFTNQQQLLSSHKNAATEAHAHSAPFSLRKKRDIDVHF